MRYMGGKTRQGKHIEEQLLKYRGDCVKYVEPFMGGGAIFARMAPHFPGAAYGSDIHSDLMMMWGALQNGWQPPSEVSRDDWYRIKDEAPSALRGFVGFGCSFGGRWFEGYAASRGDDYCGQSRRSVLKQVAAMHGAHLRQASYTSLAPGSGTLVYCDPPYASTKPYSGTDKFDTDLFWTTMRAWANEGATVLVSEYIAPDWAEEVWRRDAVVSLNSDTNTNVAVERLFLVHPARVSDPAPTVDTMDDDREETDTPGRSPLLDDTKGPWFGAMYEGRCDGCQDRIYEGDRIRADGQGGYECEDCGEETLRAPVTMTRAQALATLAAEGPTADMASLAFEREQDAALEVLRGNPYAAIPDPPVREVTELALPTADEFMFEDPTEPTPKLNVSGQPEARRDHAKRYIVVDPELGDFRRTKCKEKKPKGITRATTFNKHAQNTIALNGWSKRNVVMGASLRPDILRRAHGLHHDTSKEQREALDRIVDELEKAAGAKVAADEGTFLHEFCDQVDAGLKTWRDAPPMYQQDIKRYVEALAAEGLEPVPGLIERTTFIREFGGVAGTFDRIFYHRPSGQYIIGDLKTGKTMKYAMDETECQEWTYAHGVNTTGIYDWNTDTWAPTRGSFQDFPIKVSETVGVIIHMPVQGPEAGSVYLDYANLERGRAYAELNQAVRSYPKSKVQPFSAAPLTRAEPTPELNNPTPDDVWRALFRTVGTKEEATEMWLRAKEDGIQGVFLNELIELAQQTLRAKG